MKRTLLAFLVLTLASPWVSAGIDCDELDRAGEDIANIVRDFGSGRDILGKERLQFYLAPDVRCKMDGLFVIPGDTLFAKFVHAGFTKVSFITMKKSDRPVTAWVISARVKGNGKGIVPGHAVDGEQVAKLFKDGNAAILLRKYESAIEKCQAGLDTLGDAYWSNEIVDDTDMKLIAAGILRRDGKLENAASMYCGILANRLELLNHK